MAPDGGLVNLNKFLSGMTESNAQILTLPPILQRILPVSAVAKTREAAAAVRVRSKHIKVMIGHNCFSGNTMH